MAFAVLSICTAFAQDSTGTGTRGTTKMHKKSAHSGTMHHNGNGTMNTDSVNGGKVTTNPRGKMSGRKRTGTSGSSSSSSSSTDSAR
jgi:hypothetical protein